MWKLLEEHSLPHPSSPLLGMKDYWRPKFGYSGDQIKHLMAVSIMVKTLGELIFIYGSLFGAFLLILNETIYDGAQNLYNSNFDEQQIEQTISKFRELADHAVTNPALFGRDEFFRRLLRFIKALAVVGALLFFVTMKHKLNNSKKEFKVKTD
ncbi:uncharacterized protein LOC106435431 isoform X2 [Brassica napus]|uniref:uncharacterized protein LOC106435431 isoform X2 n=1 Tax=Brassica napus TaxID=3708 RepID=UPI0006AB2ABB|nr:uncharacterized protein LOC106435431 isoform X2 [Brassica napus]